MTTLAIMANYEKKRLKCFGNVAAGEHVAVTVVGGAQWIGQDKALRLRVYFGPNLVGVFPPQVGEGEVAPQWEPTGEGDADAECELNLNTLQAEKYMRIGESFTCLWILDDVENHTLYATGEYDVLPWPKRRGIDEPIDLDGYPDLVADMGELQTAWEEYKQNMAVALRSKQDVINDLSAIRSGATAGASAVQPAALLAYINGGTYDSTTKKIYLKHDDSVIAEIDATDFIKDGMIDSVEVSGGNLVITFNTDSGKQPISIPLTDIFDPDNYYDKTAADARFATKADATLTERGPNHDGFSAWIFTPSEFDGDTIKMKYEYGGWQPYTDSYGYLGVRKGDAESTMLTWVEGVDFFIGFTATRTALPGYQLGDQENKPLASEAEAEALRDGKLDKSDVVSPSTSATTGQAADAKATGDALAGKLSLTGGVISGSLTLYNSATGASIYFPSGADASLYFGSGLFSASDRTGKVEINGAEAATVANIAPEYSTSGTYALNALCVRNGILYRCTTAITTAEAWTEAHWTEATVEDVLAALRTGKQDALSQTQLDNIAAVPNKADAADLRYSFNMATVSSGTTPTVTGIADRAINTVTLGSSVTAATVTLPAATAYRARDFFIDLTIEATTAPTLTFIDPATNTTANVTFGADSLADIDTGYNLILFTELPNNRWLVSVRHEEVAT